MDKKDIEKYKAHLIKELEAGRSWNYIGGEYLYCISVKPDGNRYRVSSAFYQTDYGSTIHSSISSAVSKAMTLMVFYEGRKNAMSNEWESVFSEAVNSASSKAGYHENPSLLPDWWTTKAEPEPAMIQHNEPNYDEPITISKADRWRYVCNLEKARREYARRERAAARNSMAVKVIVLAMIVLTIIFCGQLYNVLGLVLR